MFNNSFQCFLRDESGAYAVWSLLWFSLYVAMGGLAVDMTDAYRNQTLLQATADSSALAGVMSLPNQADAVAQALAYSSDNMDPTVNGNGNVLLDPDVIVGNWNFDTRTFSAGTGAVGTDGAVFVTTRRSTTNGNALATNFLRIMNLWGIPGDVWEINTEAIAVKYIPDCLKDGLHARGMVDISSNNRFLKEICIHGEDHVEVQNNNFWEPGVEVTMPSLADMPQMESRINPKKNEGLAGALDEGDLDPKMVDQVPMIINTLLNPSQDPVRFPETSVIPNYITFPTGGGYPQVETYAHTAFEALLPSLAVADAVADDGPGIIYHVTCSANKNFSIPDGLIFKDMVIVSDCNISVGDSLLTDVTLASTGGNGKVSKANIGFSSGSNLGLADDCAPGGGVRLFSNSSIHSAAKMTINGVQMVAQGDIHISAGAKGANGIAAQAGGDIKVTSNNIYGRCAGGSDAIFTAWYYRLVQ